MKAEAAVSPLRRAAVAAAIFLLLAPLISVLLLGLGNGNFLLVAREMFFMPDRPATRFYLASFLVAAAFFFVLFVRIAAFARQPASPVRPGTLDALFAPVATGATAVAVVVLGGMMGQRWSASLGTLGAESLGPMALGWSLAAALILGTTAWVVPLHLHRVPVVAALPAAVFVGLTAAFMAIGVMAYSDAPYAHPAIVVLLGPVVTAVEATLTGCAIVYWLFVREQASAEAAAGESA